MLDLQPSFKIGKIKLAPSVGKGSLIFGKGSASLKLELVPFFQGAPGPAGEDGRDGVDGAAGNPAFVFNQNTPQSVWTIDHGLGHWPIIYILDTTGEECEGFVTNPTFNQTVVTFSAPFAGQARLT